MLKAIQVPNKRINKMVRFIKAQELELEWRYITETIIVYINISETFGYY